MTGYVAVEPGLTDTVWVVKIGAVCPVAPTSNCNEDDVPPPGAGVSTVTEVVPAVATCAAAICAVSLVELTYCVVSAEVPK